MVATSCDPSRLIDLQELGNIIPQQLDVRAGDQDIQAHVNEISECCWPDQCVG